jgi:pimeloyl-ACP methyl ester carboxylesterase
MSEEHIDWLVHAKVTLALHRLRDRRPDAIDDAHPLLLLHGLGESTPTRLDPVFERWPGSIHGLDFTGHGRSTVPQGGGYTAEVLMADADAALAKLGPLTICGRGLGAYVALLLAGGRAREVRGAILCDGAGLAGGGPSPSSPHVVHPDPHACGAPDPFALAEMSLDLRPRDYAVAYVRQAAHLSPVERPILVCARNRPSWLSAVLDEADTETCSIEDALDQLSEPSIRRD